MKDTKQALWFFLALVMGHGTSAGQVQHGDIVVADVGGTSEILILDAATATTTSYLPPPFAGVNLSVLWDPASPADVVVGGNGMANLVSITGPASASLATIANPSPFSILQFSFGPNNDIVGGDVNSDHIRSIDLMSGVVSFITSGPQPWGSTMSAAIFDPRTGDYYVANVFGIYRWNPTSGASLLASGWSGNSVPQQLALDPFSFDIFATISGAGTDNRVIRIDPSGSFIDVIAPGAIANPKPIVVDENGDLVIGSAFNGFLYRVPNAGGTPVLFAVLSFAPTSLSVIGGLSYGAPSNPFSAWMSSASDGSLTLRLTDAATSAFGGVTIVSADTSLAQGTGPVFGMTPDALSLQLFLASPAPSVGNPFNFLTGFAGFYPDASYVLPAGTASLLAGITLDCVGFTYDPAFVVDGVSNVARIAL